MSVLEVRTPYLVFLGAVAPKLPPCYFEQSPAKMNGKCIEECHNRENFSTTTLCDGDMLFLP
ncbi:MAG: hypothetical protein ACREQZ_11580 [Woeseiaceae bacterium]